MTVPQSDYTPEHVAQLIVEKAKRIEAVHQLKGTEALNAYR